MSKDTEILQDKKIDFYWRPGCPFCMSLEAGLNRKNIVFEKHNIWEDEEAAKFVRSVANGNEIVPTLRIGDMFMVNPSVKQVARNLFGEPDKRSGLFSKKNKE
jgi:mycoredoxin